MHLSRMDTIYKDPDKDECLSSYFLFISGESSEIFLYMDNQ